MPLYEVDILVTRPVTVQVPAADQEEAKRKAMAGQGHETSGIDYEEADIVDVRVVEEDL